MNKRRIHEYKRRHRRHSAWQSLVTSIAAVVVFCTTYALILPAITLESAQPVCGVEEHVHTAECVNIVCGREEVYDHTHDETCYENGILVCGKKEFQGHTHGAACYQTLQLVCGLEEQPGHVHDAACRDEQNLLICTQEESAPHSHSSICYTAIEQAEPACGREETQYHTHDDSCRVMICSLPEHTHTENCFETDDSGETEQEDDCEQDSEPIQEIPMLFGMMRMAASNSLAASNNDISQWITSAKGSSTEYNNSRNYITNLTVKVDNVPKQTIIDNNYTMQYTLPADVKIPDYELNKNYNLMDGQQKGGTFCFIKNADGTYSCQMTFDQNYVGSKVTISGEQTFECDVNYSNTINNNTIRIPFTNSVDVEVDVSKVKYPENSTNKYDIQTQKDQGKLSADGKTLTYTVTVSSKKGTPGPINLEDVIQVTKNGAPSTDIALTLASCTVDGQTGNATYDNTSGKLSVSNLSQLSAGGTHTITYTYNVSGMQSGSYCINNKATAKTYDTGTNTELKHTAEVNTWTSGSTTNVSKKGTVNGNKIDWTIEYNAGGADIAGKTLKDPMLNQAMSGTISVNPNYGYQRNGDTIQFTATNGGKNTSKYTITYSTQTPQGGFGDTEVKNTVTDSDGQTAEATVPVPGSGTVGKKNTGAQVSADKQTADVDWEITLNVPTGAKIQAGSVITDTANYVDYTAKGLQYFTEAQKSTVIAQLDSLLGQGNYTIQWTVGETWGDQALVGKTIGYTATVKNDVNKTGTLTMKYSTTALLDSGNGATIKFINKIEVNKKSCEAVYNYIPAGGKVSKTDGNGTAGTSTSADADGKLTWKVQTTYDQNYKTVTVTDTLPADVTLQKNSSGDYYLDVSTSATFLGAWCNNQANQRQIVFSSTDGVNYTGAYIPSQYASNGDAYYKYTASYNVKTGVIAVTMDVLSPTNQQAADLTGQSTIVTYSCQIDPTVVAQAKKEVEDQYPNAAEGAVVKSSVRSYTNSANVTVDNVGFGSASQTQDWTESKQKVVVQRLDKAGKYEDYNKALVYSVKINPLGEDLVPGSDNLTIVDVLKYSTADDQTESRTITLNPTTVALYYGIADPNDPNILTKGKPVSFAWTLSTVEGKIETKTYWHGGDQVNKTYETHTVEHTLTGTVPDSTPLILEYTYDLDIQPRAKVNWNGADGNPKVGAVNSSHIDGTGFTDTEDKSNTDYVKSSASGTIGGFNVFTFWKVDSKNFGTTLNGAEFTVFRADNNAAVNIYTSKNGVFSIGKDDTDTNGKACYEAGVLYYVKETKAPTDYLPDPNLVYYFYWTDDTHGAPTNIPAGVTAINLTKGTKTEYVPNEAIHNISVDKKWFNLNGTTQTPPTGISVKVQLYQVQVSSNGTPTNPNKIYDASNKYGTEITLDASNGFACSFKQLPGFNTNGQEVAYYLKETAVLRNGVDVTDEYVSTTANNGILSGTITLNNRQVTTAIAVEKVWAGLANGKQDEVTFELYRAEADSENDLKGAPYGVVYNQTVLPNNGTIKVTKIGQYTTSNLKWSSADVPLKLVAATQDGKYYSYFVIEKPDSAYEVTYTNNGTNTGMITITNTQKKEYTSISVDKKWYDYFGASQAPGTQSISFQLYQIATVQTPGQTGTNTGSSGGNSTGTGGTMYGNPITMGTATSWNWTSGPLIKTEIKDDGSVYSYTYYVKETPIPGYSTDYDQNDGIDTGTITIKNTSDRSEGFQLPNTGGTGTAAYTISGLLLITIAVLGALWKVRAKRANKGNCETVPGKQMA